jgi:hypothetical protein
VPIASYGRISTSHIAHHVVWIAAIASAATTCATTAPSGGGSSGKRRAIQPITGENTTQTIQIRTS